MPVHTTSETSNKLPREVSEIVERIVQFFAPERVILFGSHAYGRATADSDLDLLVIMETELPSAERIRRISRVLVPRRLPLDIVVKTPKEIQKSSQRVDPFLKEVLSKGVVLYARS